MKVFHGGFISIEKPDIIISKFPKDFGEGFYCTKIEEQAVRWSSRYDTAVVSVYEYIPNENLRILVFEEMTEEWLDFIVECRAGGKHNYDIVIGAMANDQIYNYVSDFIDGIINREQFWVLAKFKHPTHQVCFCNDEALKTINFIESKIIENYDRKRR